MRSITIIIVAAMAAAAHADSRVIVMTGPDDTAALRVALAGLGTELVVQPEPQGELRLERAAAAQRSALDDRASAAVWIEQQPGTSEVCVVSADGHVLRHAPLPIVAASPRVFAAIAASLLDDLLSPSPGSGAVRVGVQVEVAPMSGATPAPTQAPPSTPAPEIALMAPGTPVPMQALLPTPTSEAAPGQSVAAIAAPSSRAQSSKILIGAGGFFALRDFKVHRGVASVPARTHDGRHAMQGIQAAVAYYPRSLGTVDGDVSGIGFTFGIARSANSMFTAMDETGYGDYSVQHTEWDAAIHYRHPLNNFVVDGEVSYGENSTQFVDLPESIQVPDTDYRYAGAGLQLIVDVVGRGTAQLGARYMYMLSAGDITNESWYGAATGYGYALDAHVTVPLLRSRFSLKGGLEYREQRLDFSGFGELSQEFDAWNARDGVAVGSLNLLAMF